MNQFNGCKRVVFGQFTAFTASILEKGLTFFSRDKLLAKSSKYPW
jgi:hypothetical protein